MILAGCANNSPEALAARVGNASNYQLCRAILVAPHEVAQIAQGEADRRSLDCAPFASAVLQERAQADAARAAAAQQILSRPAIQPYQLQPYQMQPYSPPPQVNCQTYRVGNTLQTNCH